MASLLKTDKIVSTAASASEITLPTPASPNGSGWYSGRNILINGAMQVSQRGTSEAGLGFTSYGYYKAPDRWRASIEIGTWTVSQASIGPAGFPNSYKFDCTTADASPNVAYATQLACRIQAQDLQELKYGTADAETITVSFWVRSAKTGTYIVELQHGETSISNSIAYTISVADTWEKKELSFSGYTTTAIADDNGIGLYLNFWLAAGTNYTSGTLAPNTWQSTAANKAVGQVNLADSTSNDWHLTGVQLEIGSVATPFEHKSFAQQLWECQTYWQRVKQHWWSYATSAAVIDSFVQLTPDMRAAPSVTLDDDTPTFQKVNVANYTGTSSSITASTLTTTTAFVRIDGFSGLANNSDYLLVSTPFYFEAEL